MKHIALLCAMTIEAVPFKRQLDITDEFLTGTIQSWEGTYAGQHITLVQSGVGKVHAAAATQTIISQYALDAIFSCGTAGSLNPVCHIGDVVVGETTVQHDYGFITPETFIPFGIQINRNEDEKQFLKAFPGDAAFLTLARALESKHMQPFKVRFGSVLTGDQVIWSSAKRQSLAEQFNGLAVDMESAAIAQIAHIHKIPFLTIRGISDHADESIPIDPSKIDLNEFGGYASAPFGKKLELLTQAIRYFARHPSKFALSLEAKRQIKTAAQNAATFALELIKSIPAE